MYSEDIDHLVEKLQHHIVFFIDNEQGMFRGEEDEVYIFFEYIVESCATGIYSQDVIFICPII